MKKLLIFSAVTLLVLTACNKEKRYSNRLMKGETWRVLDITIDGSTSAFSGEWQITTDVDIYDSVPRLQWIDNNQDAVCEWQFQAKGKSFQLNYYQLCEEPTGATLNDLDYFANDISGKYDVGTHKKKKMSFVSMNTIGFPGQKVEISIDRID
ncbi:hypothetical protein N9F08_00900 [bacterium]|nr:hypothetical protein [bacterium]